MHRPAHTLTLTLTLTSCTAPLTLKAAIDAPASRSLLAGRASPVAYSPGMSLPITTTYTGFYPNEVHYLFYSLVTPAGEEIKVHEEKFKSAASGSGSHTAHWTVPSDNYFATDGEANNAHIIVRCSNLLSRAVKVCRSLSLYPRV